MKDLKTIIKESVSKKTREEVQKYIDIIEPFLSKIIPNLNKNWDECLSNFKNSTIEDAKEYASSTTLKGYRGYEGRFSYQDGQFSRYYSCWDDKEKEIINKLNNKKLKDKFEYYNCLFSTCCEELESNGFDDPMVEWTVGDFRKAEMAIIITISKLIGKNN